MEIWLCLLKEGWKQRGLNDNTWSFTVLNIFKPKVWEYLYDQTFMRSPKQHITSGVSNHGFGLQTSSPRLETPRICHLSSSSIRIKKMKLILQKKTCKIEPSLLTSNSCVLPMDLKEVTHQVSLAIFAPSFLQVNSSIYFQVPFIPRSQNPVTSGLVRVVVPQTCDHQPPKNKRI